MTTVLIPEQYITPEYRRAVTAVPALRALEHVVRSFAGSCSGCAWSLVLKPLAAPHVGWGRSRVLDSTSPDTDAWLRTSKAHNAVVNVWLAYLDAADLGEGHRLRYPRERG